MDREENVLVRSAAEPRSLGVVRVAALTALSLGAVVSIGFMLHAARRQQSRVLLLLFGVWVLSPFVAAAVGIMVSKRWSVVTRAALYIVMLVFTLASLAIYGDVAFGQPRVKIGFVFLVVPFASWVAMLVVVPIAALISRRSR